MMVFPTKQFKIGPHLHHLPCNRNYKCGCVCLCCSCVHSWSCCSAFFRAVRPGISSSSSSLSPGRPTRATLSCSTTSTLIGSGSWSLRWVTAKLAWNREAHLKLLPSRCYSAQLWNFLCKEIDLHYCLHTQQTFCEDVFKKVDISSFYSLFAQLFERMLRCDRVYEKNKQRLRLREAGYSSLSLLFSDLHITPTLIRCLLNQVLHTGLFYYFNLLNVFSGLASSTLANINLAAGA